MNKLTWLAASLLLAITPAAAQQPKTGGTLIIALNSDARSLEPGVNRDANTDTVVHQIFEGLIAYRADLGVGPALADSWTVEDGGKAYRFTLRDGVRFHNGAPLTAADVKWSWDRQFAHPAWPCKVLFDGSAGLKVEAVEAPSPREVVIRIAQASALFLPQLANIQCAVLVFHRDSIDAEGKWKTPIGTGPLKLKEWRTGEQITLERFADYVPSSAPPSGFSGARKMLVDQVQFKVIPDASAAEAALQTGAIDIIPQLDPQKMAALKQRGIKIATTPGLGWATLLIQTRDPLFSDPRMRRALAHAIDTELIAETRSVGLTKANSSAVSASSKFYEKAFGEWPAYDPAKAAALLKEAGYKGQPVKIQTNKRYVGMYDNSVMIQAMLTAAGFKAELEVFDWATQLDNYNKGNFQLQSFGYSARFDPGLMYAAFVADKTARPNAQWEDPEAIRLLADSTFATDDAKRKEIFVKMHALMKEQVPIIGLYYDPIIEAAHPRVEGYVSWPANRTITWGVWKN